MGHPAVLQVLLEGELTVIPADDGMFCGRTLQGKLFTALFLTGSHIHTLIPDRIPLLFRLCGLDERIFTERGKSPTVFGRCVGRRGFQRVFWSLQ